MTLTESAIEHGMAEANCAIENCWGALHASGDLKRAIHHAQRARHWLDLVEQLARASAAQPLRPLCLTKQGGRP